MNGRLWAVVTIVATLGTSGCSASAQPNCDGGGVVCSLTLDAHPATSNDAGTTYIVTIDTEIPNLQGGALASVATSDGTVAGVGPGGEATVFLPSTPGAARSAGTLSGKVTWIVPSHETVQLTVRIDERTATTTVQTP